MLRQAAGVLRAIAACVVLAFDPDLFLGHYNMHIGSNG